MAWVNTEPWTTAPSSPYRPTNPNAWTTNGAQNQTPVPVVAPMGAGAGAGGPTAPVDQFAQAFAGVPWGTFGTYDNWANAYAGQHGQAPNAQAITDYWDSQAYMAANGRAPSSNEWNNRWWTGDWQGRNPWNQGVNNPGWGLIPARYLGSRNGEGGYNAFEPGFAEWSPRGGAVSPLYQQAMANPTNLWRSMAPGFTAWQNYLANRQPQMNAAPAVPGTTIQPVVALPQTYAPQPAPLVRTPQGGQLPVIVKTAYPGPAAYVPPPAAANQSDLAGLIQYNRQPWPNNPVNTPQMQVYRPPARVGYLRTGW
jgi:hypothetical protein